MIDKTKVIHGLECCEALHNGGEVQCATKCPYWLSDDGAVDNNCRGRLIFDALALLKEQELELQKLRDCNHACKIDCLLKEYNKLAEERDALKRAQEPRVMTLKEALAADYVYLEIRLHPNLPCECCILAVERDGDILALKRGFGGYLDREEYGETWRSWTERPTDEQREATPWND